MVQKLYKASSKINNQFNMMKQKMARDSQFARVMAHVGSTKDMHQAQHTDESLRSSCAWCLCHHYATKEETLATCINCDWVYNQASRLLHNFYVISHFSSRFDLF